MLAGVDLVTVPLTELRPGCPSPNRQLLDDYRYWLDFSRATAH